MVADSAWVDIGGTALVMLFFFTAIIALYRATSIPTEELDNIVDNLSDTIFEAAEEETGDD